MRRMVLTRREVLQAGAAAGAAAVASPLCFGAENAPNRKVRVGVMGVSQYANGGNGRGCELALGLASLSGVEVAYVCDVDERHVQRAAGLVAAKQASSPRAVGDFRRILDDKSVDALAIATPDHWHAPATILACAAGKHVYCEKPACHNPREGQWQVAAARKHNRIVQLGTQRRSWPAIIEGIDRLKSGELGRVIAARTYYFNNRPSIGRGKQGPPPQYLDYSLWQGPAPERPYADNILHYNWHWFWHWGTGEAGNNAVHSLDVARWGLGVDLPQRVTSSGGKYRYPDDDQETPDTNTVALDFGDRLLTWEQRSWAKQTALDPAHDVAFECERGRMLIRGAGYVIQDESGKEIAKGTGKGNNEVHLQNFVNAVREEGKLNAEIEQGVKSTLLCHLANIAWRVVRELKMDPNSGQIEGDPDAMKLWGREYRRGWEPVV